MGIADFVGLYFVGLLLYFVVLLICWASNEFSEQTEKDFGFALSFMFVWPLGVLVTMWLISYRLFKYGRS